MQSESDMTVKDLILLVVYLLVPLACNFTKRWTLSQIIYKVFDQSLDNYFVENILVASHG